MVDKITTPPKAFGDVTSKINEVIDNAQLTSNLVTSLSSSSTDTQYPSAKCVYYGSYGLPVPKQQSVFEGKTVQSSYYSLSSYLPDSVYPYELFVTVWLSSNNTTQLYVGNIEDPYTNRNSGAGIIGGANSISSGTQNQNSFWLPVGTGRKLYYQLAGSASSYTSYVAIKGYRRMGKFN